MGGCQSNVVHQEIEPFMAMWVLKVSDFIKMELPMPKHEELLERGLLRRRELTDYCIFVSHQWISTTHPDPAGHQLRVLQQCLVHICDHQLSITNDAASQFLGEMKKLSKSQRDKVRKAVLWIDWASIPQVETFRNEDDEEDEICQLKRERSSRTFVYRSPASPKRVSEQEEFILSLPSFVQASQVFVALVPPLRHLDTGQICDYLSWITRGWCRTEMFCKMMLGNQDMPIVIVSASDLAHYARPANWVDWLPHEGEFSYPGDRPVVKGIFEQAISHQLCFLEGERRMDLFRYFLARREVMTGLRPVRRTMSKFLDDFCYGSLERSQRSKFGPVIIAALAGDVELLKSLLEARCSMEKRSPAMPAVGIDGNLTPLHLALMQGWRSPKVIEILMEAQADPNLPAIGVPPLACCRTARDVQTLLEYRADVNGHYAPLHVPVLALASGESPPEVIAKLLQSRASPNAPGRSSGLGMSPLSFLAITANSNPHALPIAQLLVAATADLNAQVRCGGIFRALELLSRAYLQIATPRSVLMMAMAEQSTTPLGFACLFDCQQLVNFLLDARADAEVRNSRGHRPIDLVQSQEIAQVLREHLEHAEDRHEDRHALPAAHHVGSVLPASHQHLSTLQCSEGSRRPMTITSL
ncbi:unnamed protein product [Durusdinium trenchii]